MSNASAAALASLGISVVRTPYLVDSCLTDSAHFHLPVFSVPEPVVLRKLEVLVAVHLKAEKNTRCRVHIEVNLADLTVRFLVALRYW